MKRVKVPTNFNMAIIGERGSGKSTYLNDFIRSAKDFPEKEIYVLCDSESKGKFDFKYELINDEGLQALLDCGKESLIIFDNGFLTAAGTDAIINGRLQGVSTIVLLQNCTGRKSLNAKARAAQDCVVCIGASPLVKASIANFFFSSNNIILIDKYDESRIPKPRKSLRAPLDT